MTNLPTYRPVPRWLHLWAILTVAATTCLLAIGALVTTFRVGMTDPIWPTTPWYLFFINWEEPRRGFLVEHIHRLAGWTVGLLVIVLAVGLWTTPRTRGTGLRLLGTAALVGVILQGMLGGFRVRLNAWAGTDLAAVHGIFAQCVFSLFVAIAVLPARRSAAPPLVGLESPTYARFHGNATLLVGLVFLQLIWGALIRHTPNPLVQRLHLLTAFAVLGAGIWLIKKAHESTAAWNRLKKPSILLAVFLTFQIILGVEAWMGKFASGVLPELQKITAGMAIIRTAHVLIGTGILATSVSLFLITRRTATVPVVESQREPVLASKPAAGVLGGVS
jgi:heme A synthase